jgi:hypothetical protein
MGEEAACSVLLVASHHRAMKARWLAAGPTGINERIHDTKLANYSLKNLSGLRHLSRVTSGYGIAGLQHEVCGAYAATLTILILGTCYQT